MLYELPDVGEAKKFPSNTYGTTDGPGAWVADDIEQSLGIYSKYLAQLLVIKNFLDAEAEAEKAQLASRVEKAAKVYWASFYNTWAGAWESKIYDAEKDKIRRGVKAILAALDEGKA